MYHDHPCNTYWPQGRRRMAQPGQTWIRHCIHGASTLVLISVGLLSCGLLVAGCTSSGSRPKTTTTNSAPKKRIPPKTGIVEQRRSNNAQSSNAISQKKKFAPQRKPVRKILVIPLGDALPKAAIREAALGLEAIYGLHAKVTNRRPLPDEAYFPPRKRYRADRILAFLAHLDIPKSESALKLLAITAVDISTTKGRYKDWGIMGLGELGGRYAVVSMFRCRRASRSAAQARHRFAKTVAHEIGHTLGLRHCPNRGCIMEDARGTNETSDREYSLCAACRAKLKTMGFGPLPVRAPPWPRPTRR